jgi:hypothetical protein
VVSLGKQVKFDSEHLENLLEFETLISDLSSRFINLPAGDVDREWEMKDLPRSRI